MFYTIDAGGEIYGYDQSESSQALMDARIKLDGHRLYSPPELDSPPPPTPEQIAAAAQAASRVTAKAARDNALATIVVTTQSGKTFDGNETARSNMLCAITVAGFVNQTSTNWRLADNTVAQVTFDEVREALALSITRAGEIYTAAI